MATFEQVNAIAEKKLNSNLSKHIVDYKELFNNINFDEDSLEVFEYFQGCDLRVVADASIKSEDFSFNGRVCLRICRQPYNIRVQTNKETWLEVYFIRNNELCGIVNLSTYSQLDNQLVVCNVYRSERLTRYIDQSLCELTAENICSLQTQPNPSYQKIHLTSDTSIIEEIVKSLNIRDEKVEECVNYTHARYESVSGFQRGLR